MQMLSGVCTLLRFERIDNAVDCDEAFDFFCAHNHDVVITDAHIAPHGWRDLVGKVRDTDGKSPNPDVPILLTCGQDDTKSADSFRKHGVTDLLVLPFLVDDIRNRLTYIFENIPSHKTPDAPSGAVKDMSPIDGIDSAEDEHALVKSLLGHYLQHQEAVLKKLEFAQDATLKSIQEIRDVGEDLKTRDNTNLHDFSRLETMWAEIIDLFVTGGLSEEDIFKIEGLITNIPEDVKAHYTDLTQQDKSFLTMIEAMNHDAYRKARGLAIQVQEAPNPMTGMTRNDYAPCKNTEPTIAIEKASFFFAPKKSA